MRARKIEMDTEGMNIHADRRAHSDKIYEEEDRFAPAFVFHPQQGYISERIVIAAELARTHRGYRLSSELDSKRQ